MLCEAAARLALIEGLAPTSAFSGASAFPTKAGRLVLDSCRIGADAFIDPSSQLPVISVYSGETTSERRADAAAIGDAHTLTTLEIIVELAIKIGDGEDGAFADAAVANDAEAELMLETIVSQIKFVAEVAPEGALFRKISRGSILRFQSTPDVLPETGIRMARRFISMDFEVSGDRHFDDGGLPEPIKTLRQHLPAGSIVTPQLDVLAGYFQPIEHQNIDAVTLTVPSASGGAIAGQDLSQGDSDD